MKLNRLPIARRRAPADDALWQGLGDDVIALHGWDGRFVRVSEAAEHLFGRSAAELVGRSLMDVVAPFDQPTLLSALARATRDDGPGRARFDCRLRHGDSLRAHAEIALVRLPDGRLRSVTRPIEHRLCREQALREEGQRALDLASRKSDHLANVSHEIRTPLNAVIGFADALHSERFGPIGSDKYRDYARAIHDSGTHLQTLISDLLDLSKVEADELTLEPEVTSPSDIVAFCVDVMRLQADEAGLFLRAEIEQPIDPVRLDVKVVRQILLNVISNALKFTKHGGVTVRLGREGQHIVIAVIDTGVGMSPDDLALVGKRFRQARREGVRGMRGTGIGLALSKALARAHGGELRLMSESGAGTTALLRLPYDPASDVQLVEPGSNVTRLADVRRA